MDAKQLPLFEVEDSGFMDSLVDLDRDFWILWHEYEVIYQQGKWHLLKFAMTPGISWRWFRRMEAERFGGSLDTGVKGRSEAEP